MTKLSDLNQQKQVIQKMLFDLEERFPSNFKDVLCKFGLSEFITPGAVIRHETYLKLLNFYLEQNHKKRFTDNCKSRIYDFCTSTQRLHGEKNLC